MHTIYCFSVVSSNQVHVRNLFGFIFFLHANRLTLNSQDFQEECSNLPIFPTDRRLYKFNGILNAWRSFLNIPSRASSAFSFDPCSDKKNENSLLL